jgi:hypothetical protein
MRASRHTGRGWLAASGGVRQASRHSRQTTFPFPPCTRALCELIPALAAPKRTQPKRLALSAAHLPFRHAPRALAAGRDSGLAPAAPARVNVRARPRGGRALLIWEPATQGAPGTHAAQRRR